MGRRCRHTPEFKITSKFLSSFGFRKDHIKQVEASPPDLGKGSFWTAKQQLCSHKKSGEEERERKGREPAGSEGL